MQSLCVLGVRGDEHIRRRYNSFVPEASTREANDRARLASGPRRWTLRQRIVLR